MDVPHYFCHKRYKGKKYKLSFQRQYVPPSGQMIHLPHCSYEELSALSYFEAGRQWCDY